MPQDNSSLTTPLGRREPATAAERALLTFIKTDVQMIAKVNGRAQREQWPYTSFSDFVLKHGVFFDLAPEIPKGLRRGKLGRCFGNSGEVISSSVDAPYIYVEGYALNVIPVLHAWLTTPETRQAIDLTWPEGKRHERAYFGIPFQSDFVLETAYARKVWGVLDDTHRKWPVLRGEFRPERMIFGLG